MSAKTRAALTAGANSAYPDNTSGAITPLADRTQHIDEIDSALILAETSLQTAIGLVNYTGGLQVNGVNIFATGITYIGAADEFAVQDATTITLEAGKIYWLTAAISTAKRFIFQNNSMLTAGSQLSNSILTYTGVGAMFTAVDANFELSRIQYDHPNGSGFDVTDNVGGIIFAFIELALGISGASIGTFGNVGALIINRSTITTVDGLSISGADMSIFAASLTRFATTSGTAKCVDLNGAILQTIKISDVIFNYATGAFGISGLASSGNIPVGGLAMLTNCEFDDDLTPLENITTNDIRWEFSGNSHVPDTVKDALTSFNGSATETVITTINTPVKVNAVWTCIRESFFTCDTTGKIVTNSERNITIPIDIVAGLISAGGGAINVTVYLAKSGSIITASATTISISGSNQQLVPLPWQDETITPDDYEVYIENNTNTTNIIVESGKFRFA